MAAKLGQLKGALDSSLAGKIVSLSESLGELTLVVYAKDHSATARWLRDDPAVRFEELVDLCGVDYSGFGELLEAHRRVVAQASRSRGIVLRIDHQRQLAQGFAEAHDLPGERRVERAFQLFELRRHMASIRSARDGVGALDLVLQLDDSVEQRLRRRRAARNVYVHRHDAVASAHHRVGVMV